MPFAVPLPEGGPLRNERKFPCAALTPLGTRALVASLPGAFRAAFPDRRVNSLYLDSADRTFHGENLAGVPARVKARIRWYGPLSGRVRPTLELKIKQGHLGRKVTAKLPELDLVFPAAPRLLHETARDLPGLPPALREFLRPLSPAVLNRYRRSYFVSACGRFRLTVDFDLDAFALDGRPLRRLDGPGSVIELKYAPEHDGDARSISSALPFRLSRHSKYVDALDRARAGA